MTLSNQVLISGFYHNFQKSMLVEHRSEFRVNRSHGLLVPGFWSTGGPCCGPNFCPNFFCAFGKPIWETSFADHENRRTPIRKTTSDEPENNIRRTGKQHPPITKTRSAEHENRRTPLMVCLFFVFCDVQLWHSSMVVFGIWRCSFLRI